VEQPDVQHFKIQIVSFIAVLTTAAVTGRLGFLGKNAGRVQEHDKQDTCISPALGTKENNNKPRARSSPSYRLTFLRTIT
jgi:hypothetical protein